MQWNLLVIEDDKALSDGIRLALQDAQHRIVQAETLHAGKCCLEKMIETSGRGEQERIDLVILDLNLPDGNGLELLQWIRERLALPVIILTANDLEIDIVTGLESGADDYITKPFSLMVLRARVRARLRNMQGARPMENGQEQSIQIGPFSFAFDKMEYRKNGENLVLSRTEQKLLRILVENRGKTIPKERLLSDLGGRRRICGRQRAVCRDQETSGEAGRPVVLPGIYQKCVRHRIYVAGNRQRQQ